MAGWLHNCNHVAAKMCVRDRPPIALILIAAAAVVVQYRQQEQQQQLQQRRGKIEEEADADTYMQGRRLTLKNRN